MKTKTWNVLLIVILTAVAAVWAMTLWNSTQGYRPAYRQPQEQGRPLPTLVPRVVLVIIDGLRYDMAETMPSLRQIQQRGATAKSIAALPSVSQPTWTTLVSGARPEINGAVLFNAEYEDIQPIAVDHIFQLAKQAGLTTALAGQQWWKKMVPPEYLDRTHFVEGSDAAGDLEATQAALDFLRDPEVNLLLLYLGEYDMASDTLGAKSPAALQALEHLNDALSLVLASVDWNNTLLAVTADHGQLDQGGHAGDDKTVLETPFVMAGPRVRPGNYPAIQQPDIAMTLAALLGTPLPRSGQGRILYEFLDVSPAEKARGEAALIAQKLIQSDAYLSAIHAETVPAQIRVQSRKLDDLLQAEEFEAADRLANNLLLQIEHHVARVRATKITQSRLTRLPIVLLGLVLLLVTFVLNWRSGQKAALLLSLLGVAACHAFWLLRGHVYSLSTLGGPGGFTYGGVSLAGGTCSALLLGLVLLGLRSIARRGKGAAAPSSQPVSAFCAGWVGTLFLLATLANVGNGGLGNWNIIIPVLAFLLLLSLLQTVLAGLLSLVTVGLFALVARVRRK